MSNIDDIKHIIKEFTSNDTANIIFDFTWSKCQICMKHKENVYELAGEDYICPGCVHDAKLSIYKCNKCRQYYLYQKNSFCILCFTRCRYYCECCMKPEYIITGLENIKPFSKTD